MANQTTRLKTHLPDYYADIYDMQALNSIEQYMIDHLAVTFDKSQRNLYAATADDEGLKIFEQLLDLAPVGTLEERRLKVISALLPQRAVTMDYLNDIIGLLGINAKAELKGFNVAVTTSTPQAGALVYLKAILDQYLPANLTYDITNVVEDQTAGTQSVVGFGTSSIVLKFESRLGQTVITRHPSINLVGVAQHAEIIEI